MAQTVSILLCGDDRTRLEAIVADRNRRHKHVQRAQIVLLSAERRPVAAIAEAVGVSRPSVWRWQQRFAEDGVAALLKDRTRPPGKPRLSEEAALKVVALTCSEPPGAACAHQGACSPLDRSGHGQGGWHIARRGAAHLGQV
jgi:hypothetical protein